MTSETIVFIGNFTFTNICFRKIESLVNSLVNNAKNTWFNWLSYL